MLKKIKKVRNYLSLVKFSHTIFAMPFALIGYFIAIRINELSFSWKLLGLVILCMVFARDAAMAFNRYVDRDIDIKNPRTFLREIPLGIIKPRSALRFVIINCALFVATTYFINSITFYLSHVALVIILTYSITKKFTSLCHFVLGIGLSLAPAGAYLAVTGTFDLLPILYSGVVLFWVSGFDIIYALQDEEFDKQEALHSIPVFLGKDTAIVLSIILHIFSGALVIYAGIYAGFGIFYWIGTFLFLGLLIYQHLLVKPHDLSKVNLAFFTLNGVASILFSVFTILDLFFRS